MELICHSSARKQSKELLLPNFMKGFLYGLYVQKWRNFGRWVFLARLLLHLSYVMLVTLIAAPSILGPSADPEGAPSGVPSLSESLVPVLVLLILALLLLALEVTEFGLSCATAEAKPLEESAEANFNATFGGVACRIDISLPKTIGALRMMNERGGHIHMVSIFCAPQTRSHGDARELREEIVPTVDVRGA